MRPDIMSKVYNTWLLKYCSGRKLSKIESLQKQVDILESDFETLESMANSDIFFATIAGASFTFVLGLVIFAVIYY